MRSGRMTGSDTRMIRLDLTNHVEGTYGYLIKVTLQADRAGKCKFEQDAFV